MSVLKSSVRTSALASSVGDKSSDVFYFDDSRIRDEFEKMKVLDDSQTQSYGAFDDVPVRGQSGLS